MEDVYVEILLNNKSSLTIGMTILSVIHQTVVPKNIVLVDHGPMEDSVISFLKEKILPLCSSRNISLQVIDGDKKGVSHSHQTVMEKSPFDLIWRIFDGYIAEPGALHSLLSYFSEEKMAAVGGLSLTGGSPKKLPSYISGKIEESLSHPFIQSYYFDSEKSVDFLVDTFLYNRRCFPNGYRLDLSPFSVFCDEIFTFGAKMNGYKIVADPFSVGWQMESPRTFVSNAQNDFFQNHDQKIYEEIITNYGKIFKDVKLVLLDSGIGDHWAFRAMLCELKEKVKKDNAELFISCAYPSVFEDEKDIHLISRSEALVFDNKIDNYNIYKYCWKNNLDCTLTDSFRRMYL